MGTYETAGISVFLYAWVFKNDAAYWRGQQKKYR